MREAPVEHIKCPRCGAINTLERAACWNCWAPLPRTANQHQPTKAIASPERSATSTQRPSPGEPTISHMTPAAHGDIRAPRRRLGLPITLAMLLLAAIGCWIATAHPRFTTQGVDGTVQTFLDALVYGDTGTQQQFASEDSKGMVAPRWLTVIRWQLDGLPNVTGSRALAPIALELAPTAGDRQLSPAAATSLSGSYRVSLPLLQEHGVWRVDQHGLFNALHQAIVSMHPNVPFPSWE